MANIPVAIEAARARYPGLRAAVLDWDVHHGNGTQAIYYDRADTLTISIHQQGCYPADSGLASERGAGAGQGFNLNINLIPGMGHASYLEAMEIVALPAIRAFAPDLIVVACGLDANGFDPLARMQAHSGTFRAMTQRVLETADELCGGRLVCVHEGGYSEAVVPFCGLAVIEELAGMDRVVEDPTLPMIAATQPDPEVIVYQRDRLQALAKDLAPA